MGYNTRFKLKYQLELNDDTGNVLTSISEILRDSTISCYIECNPSIITKTVSNKEYTHLCYEPAKWYNHVDDILALSLKFPEIIFSLHGLGEDNEDMWIKYFRNCQMQECRAQITFEPFDPDKFE